MSLVHKEIIWKTLFNFLKLHHQVKTYNSVNDLYFAFLPFHFPQRMTSTGVHVHPAPLAGKNISFPPLKSTPISTKSLWFFSASSQFWALMSHQLRLASVALIFMQIHTHVMMCDSFRHPQSFQSGQNLDVSRTTVYDIRAIKLIMLPSAFALQHLAQITTSLSEDRSRVTNYPSCISSL